MPARLIVVLFGSFIAIAPEAFAGDAKEAERPFGIEERIPWTTSRVIGSPDPPLPYRAAQTFSQLEFENPLYIEHEPETGRFLVVQQKGKVLRFENDPDVEQAEVLLKLERETYGLTFHPDYLKNGYLYVVSNGPPSAEVKKNRVSRFTVERDPPYRCDPDSELVIIEWESNGHNGGDLAFGPDGYLYIPAGDGTSDSDALDSGQDLSNLAATMIRIDVDRPGEGKAYSVPDDNPFLDVEEARPEIWAYGFRNPWRCTFDEKTGHLWVGNVGQDLWEMIHLVRRGENYGWSLYEGSHPFHLNRKPGPTPIVKPTIEHHHSEARSITGGIVYYGPKFPELEGAYLYGDYSTGRVWAARHDGDELIWHKEIANTSLQILGFGSDPQGNILLVDYGGEIHRLEPAPQDVSPQEFPRRLSETGIFTSVEGHKTEPALIPYSVNASLWSDGTRKERLIGVPGDLQVGYTTRRGWNFPDETVLVKTFSLDLEEGNPESRHRIETRLLTRQQGEWVGYSYAWNEEQTEANLVESAGRDRAYTIQDASAPGGSREQTWHYPSRAECMVCHSRAANFVLGLSELQMNKVHDYGSVSDNQLRTLHHIGLFRNKPPILDELAEDSDPSETLATSRRLVDPYDPAEDLDLRVRSYLHANCAQCHIKAGGGNSRLELGFSTPPEETHLFDDAPQHQTFGIADAKVVAAGDPERSLLYQRLVRRGQGQMPPLATSIVDQQAVELFREWILQLKPDSHGRQHGQ